MDNAIIVSNINMDIITNYELVFDPVKPEYHLW